MSDSLSSPWLYSAFYDLLSQDVAEQPIKRANRTVQVLRVSVPFRTMTIHDRQHSCTVFLTQACFDRFMEEYSFSVLKHSFIKLRCYHFSTAVQAGGDRDMTAMLAEKQVTLPLAVHCDRFDYVTSGDFDTSGEPIDINTDPTIRAVIYKLKYRELSEKLSQRQFPFQLCLPAYGKQITNKNNFHDDYCCSNL